MRRFLTLTVIASLSFLILSPLANAAPSVSDPNFAIDEIHDGAGLVPIVFAPGGRLYVGEKTGRILVFKPDPANPPAFLPAQVFGSLAASVEPTNERGLLGLALHPDFTSNRFVYAFYSYNGGQRLVRFQADTSLDRMSGSPQTLLDGLSNIVDNHNAGDIHFHPDGSLFLVLGDDGQPGLSVELGSYIGKILRVDESGRGLASNPFYDGDPTSRNSRIWGRGCRNPFRFTFHPVTQVMYVSENGSIRDRVSRWEEGGNGGWPNEFEQPSDSRVKNLLVLQPSITGIAITTNSAFADPGVPGSEALYIATWAPASSVRRWRLVGAARDDVAEINVGGSNTFVSGLLGAASIAFGPDGALYITTTDRSSGPGKLYRVRPVSGIAPTAAFSTDPNPPSGLAPLSVRFLDASVDDSAIVAWNWSFGDGATSTQRSPQHTYNAAGTYTATLTVSDDQGLQDSETVQVTVRSGTNLRLSGNVLDGRSVAAGGLPTSTELRLYQADGRTSLAFAGGTGAAGNAIAVAAGGAFDVTVNVELTGCGVVVTAGEPSGDGVQSATRGIAIPCGASSHSAALTFVLSGTMIRGVAMDTRGEPARVDLGVAQGEPGNFLDVAGGRDFLPPIPASGVLHRVESDELGYYSIPLPTSAGGGEFLVDVAADLGQERYLSSFVSVNVLAGSAVTQNFTLGLQSGGADCDAVATAGGLVDFAQVQELFDLHCTGCHSGLDPNADLDLGAGVSYASLVGVRSLEVPDLDLVTPGDSSESFLWEKSNCEQPQVGARMPPGQRLKPLLQTTLRDWIDQGARRSIEPAAGVLLLEARFDSGADGFTYADDVFRNTNAPAYADGGFEDGFSGSALSVDLGGIDGATVNDISGGWTVAFDIPSSRRVSLFFRFKLTQSPNYEADEVSEVLASLDSVPIGGGSGVFARVSGDGDGGDSVSTGWRGAEVDLGTVGAGRHLLTLGGYNSKKSQAQESTQVLIDDVLLFDRGGGSTTTPDIEVRPTSIDFGDVLIGTEKPVTVTIRNVGADVLGVADVGFAPRTSFDFKFVSGPEAIDLLPNAEARVVIAFRPSGIARRTGSLRVLSDDPNEGSVTIPLVGTGVAEPEPDIEVEPLARDFGSVTIGASLALDVTVRNVGSADLAVSGFELANGSSGFQLSSSGGRTLSPGEGHDISVVFSPLSVATASDTLRVRSDDPDEPVINVALSGSGIDALIARVVVAPERLDFGDVIVGTFVTERVVVRSVGTAPLEIASLVLDSNSSLDFVLSDVVSEESVRLDPEEEIVVDVTYTPSAPGSDSGAIKLTTNDAAASSLTVSLAGTGLAAPPPEIVLAALNGGEPAVTEIDSSVTQEELHGMTIAGDPGEPLRLERVRYRVMPGATLDGVSNAILAADLNGDDVIDEDERATGDVLANEIVITNPGFEIGAGESVAIRLMVDVDVVNDPIEETVASATMVLLALLALCLFVRGTLRSRWAGRAAMLSSLVLLFAVGLVVPGCNESSSRSTRSATAAEGSEIQVAIVEPGDVQLRGVASGTEAVVTGFPTDGIAGPALVIGGNP